MASKQNSNKLNVKMSKVKKLNEISEKISDTFKLSDLIVNKPYRVIAFKIIKTRNGNTPIVRLEDSIDDIIDVFLPQRFNTIPVDDNVKGVLMVYEGKSVMRNGMEYHKIKFLDMEEEKSDSETETETESISEPIFKPKPKDQRKYDSDSEEDIKNRKNH